MFYWGGILEEKKEEYTGRDPFDGFAVRVGNDEESKLVQETAFSYGYKWKNAGSIFQTYGGSYSLIFLKSENRIGFSPKDNKNFKQTSYDEMKKLGFLHKLDSGQVYVKRCIETKKIHKIFRHNVPSSVDIKKRSYVPNEEKAEPGFTYHFLDGSTRMYKWFAEMESKDKWLDPYSRLSVTDDFRYGELGDNWHEKFYRLEEGEVYFGKTKANNKVYEYLFKAGHEMECRYLMIHSENISGPTSHAYNNGCLKKGNFRLATNDESDQFNKSMLEERFVSKEEISFQETSNGLEETSSSNELNKGKWYIATMGEYEIFMNFSHSEGGNYVGHGFDCMGNWCKPGTEFGRTKHQVWELISDYTHSNRDKLNNLFIKEFGRRYRKDSFLVSFGHRNTIAKASSGVRINDIVPNSVVNLDLVCLMERGEHIYYKGEWSRELSCHNSVGCEITIGRSPKVPIYNGYGSIYPYKSIVTTSWIHHEGKMAFKDHENRTWFVEDLVGCTDAIVFNKDLQRNMTKNSDNSLWTEEMCAVNVVDPDTGESEIVLSSGIGVDIRSCGIIEPTSENVMVRNNFVATKKLEKNKTKEKRISFKEEKVVSDIPKRKSILEQDKTRIKL